MKAIVMAATGGPEALELRDVPEPKVTTDGQLKIRLKAAGVNPVDTKLRSRGTYYPERLPSILGCDGAGVVVETAKNTTRFKEGDEVYFCYGGIGGHPGNYAEYQVVDERFVAPKPKSLSFAEAAAAPLVLITAWESLYDRGRITTGQHVLIHAGAGGVGHVAVQLAKLREAAVAVTVSSSEKAGFARGMGADKAFTYQETDFVAATLEWTGGRGADVALDTVGGETFSRTLDAVRVYGDVVTLLQPPADAAWKTSRNRNQRISFTLMLTPMHLGMADALQHQANILRQCGQWFDEGRLRIHLHRILPLERAAEAHALIEQGAMTGKLVLTTE